ncbi:DDE-type integrase/transposase/recombinase [Mycobacterium stomatepiae]|nr:DDE-type integrase/transposase/recombinase [Mycobacterium stomatepiae]
MAEFRKAIAIHGVPASTLTDNGMVFTTRLSGGKGGRNGFENELRRLAVTQINSTPNHPTTCGKVERFHQTLKKMAHPSTPPHNPGPTAKPARRLRRGLQPPPPTPRPGPPHHPSSRLHRPPQSRPSKPHRQPQPRPPRPHRPSRRHHPARQRTPAPHRRRTNLHGHPSPGPRPRPTHQNHPRQHRTTPPRANPQPRNRLPTHRRPKGPTKKKA